MNAVADRLQVTMGQDVCEDCPLTTIVYAVQASGTASSPPKVWVDDDRHLSHPVANVYRPGVRRLGRCGPCG